MAKRKRKTRCPRKGAAVRTPEGTVGVVRSTSRHFARVQHGPPDEPRFRPYTDLYFCGDLKRVGR